MATPRYITTTLPYVNAEPHIGFALESVQADVYARLYRSRGERVFFNTGADEHGQKILEAAEKAGEDVQQYVDRHASVVAQLYDTLNLSYERFTRTTSEEHMRAAQELWRRCDAAGDIYKKAYRGWYCVGCEMYLAARDVDADGKCPLHPDKAPIELAEENYFFRLSKYQAHLEAYLSREGVIVPEYRRLEALAFVKDGLEDFSISRERERLSWGVPVPDDPDQVMYVWFDALANYISALGWPDDANGHFHTFWQEGETLQVAGKDQVRFQSIMWQAMLLSAGIAHTDTVFYHGFINSGGQRMSKSLGNVISPFELVERYGRDATRYMLIRHVHPTDDTDITWERLDEWYTAHLVNGLGNLASRTMKMASQYLETPVVAVDETFNEVVEGRVTYYLERYDLQSAADVIWERIGELDAYITEREPFKTIHTDPNTAKNDVVYLVGGLMGVAHMLTPLMPETAAAIKAAINDNAPLTPLFPRLAEA